MRTRSMIMIALAFAAFASTALTARADGTSMTYVGPTEETSCGPGASFTGPTGLPTDTIDTGADILCWSVPSGATTFDARVQDANFFKEDLEVIFQDSSFAQVGSPIDLCGVGEAGISGVQIPGDSTDPAAWMNVFVLDPAQSQLVCAANRIPTTGTVTITFH